MPLKVQECPAAEFAHLVGIEEKAFRFDSTEDSILFPGPFPENSTEIRVKEMIKELQDDPSSIWLKVVDTDAANPNEGIAYAKWHIYKDRTVTARPSREWGQGANVEACDAFFGSMAEKMLTYVGDKNCYCKYLAGSCLPHTGSVGFTMYEANLRPSLEHSCY